MKSLYIPDPHTIYDNLKASAKRRNIEFTLLVTDIYMLDIGITCPVLGTPMYWQRGKVTDNTPSVDRIDSSKGYSIDNIEIISVRANRAKNNLTMAELKKLGLHYS